MWLIGFYNYIWRVVVRLLGVTGTTYVIPEYRTISNVAVNTTGGYKAGGNSNMPGNSYALQMMCAIFGLKGSLAYPTSFNANQPSAALLVGSGTTPATYEDYALESLHTSGFEFTQSVGFDHEARVATQNFTITCTGVAKTISEIGFAVENVLLYRKVLSAPIELEVGESAVLTVTISMANGAVEVSV